MPSEFDEGTYFVLGSDSCHGKFVLQHDTNHCGMMGDHWLTSTHTEIHLIPDGSEAEMSDLVGLLSIPSGGWLERFLSALTSKFKPNNFSVT